MKTKIVNSQPKLIPWPPVNGIARSAIVKRMTMAMMFSDEELVDFYFSKIKFLFPKTEILLKEILEEIPKAKLPLFLEGRFPAFRAIITEQLQKSAKGGLIE